MSTRSIFLASVAISVAAAIPVLTADDRETEQAKETRQTPPAAESNEKQAPAPGADDLPSAASSTAAPSSSSPPSPVGSREHPQVVRTAVPHLQFLPDEVNVVERAGRDIPAAIVVGFGNDLAIAWDTRECRWLYAWRGGFIEPIETESEEEGESSTEIVGNLLHLSTGPAPLSVTMGAAGGARYFGHRMVDGIPEFLYTVGKLKVSERIFPSEDGSRIVQKFSVERQPVDLILAAPLSAEVTSDKEKAGSRTEDSEAALTVTNGTHKGDYIYVDSKKAGDFTLSHRIGDPLPRPGAAKPRPVARSLAIPLLTRNDPETAKPDSMPTPKPAPEPEPQPKPKPKPKPKKETDPTPPPPGKSGPIITKAQRYDRDILLTDPHVETAALKPESTAFSDREFKFSQLPEEVVGADHVRTFDRDKYIPGDILSYQLELDSDATVWLMFDKRVKPLPKWVGKNFSNTGKIAALDSGETFQVLRANVNAGKLRLGPQDSGADTHFYVIAASARRADAPKRKREEPGNKSKSE